MCLGPAQRNLITQIAGRKVPAGQAARTDDTELQRQAQQSGPEVFDGVERTPPWVGRAEPVGDRFTECTEPVTEAEGTPMSDDTRGRRPRTRWWTRLLDAIDGRISGPIDDDARRRGWTVVVLPGTRTHVYRDPRWNRRRLCDRCSGSGCVGARPCGPCDGTGVVTDRPVRHVGES